MENFGDLIAKKGKEKKLTQEQLAERLYVTRQTVSRWERGHTYPNLDTLVALSQLLGFSLDYLLMGDEKMVRDVSLDQRKSIRRKWVLRILTILFILLVAFTTNLVFKLDFREVKENEIESAVYKKQTDEIEIVLNSSPFLVML